MSSDVAISIEHISKTYRIVTTRERPTQFRDALLERARHPLRRVPREDFRALEDVSMSISWGETVGIIGRNGAGKSTLLKILSRIVGPTAGRVNVYGRLGSLLEVGTGFNPELTGRENIFLNGAILGMKRREIRRQFDSIVEFSEVERFLDTPVKRYSSGMYVRLAFAVAAHLNPEILVVDEVLSVGDAAFQEKCLGKIDEVANEGGRTVLFVSHNMSAVQAICSRCAVMEDGRIVFDGDTSAAVSKYLSSSSAEGSGADGVFDLSGVGRSSGTESVFRRIELRNARNDRSSQIMMGEGLQVRIDTRGLAVPQHELAVRIVTEGDAPVTTVNTAQRPLEVLEPGLAQELVVVDFDRLPLVPGRYWITLILRERSAARKEHAALERIDRAAFFDVLWSDVYGSGYSMPGSRSKAGLMFAHSVWQIEGEGRVVAVTPQEFSLAGDAHLS